MSEPDVPACSYPLLPNPYRPGTCLREDLLNVQFQLWCEGRTEYPEDDPIYGTYWIDSAPFLVQCGATLTELVHVAEHLANHDSSLMDRHPGSVALDFSPHAFMIFDRDHRLVLGALSGYQSPVVWWIEPVSRVDVREQIQTHQATLWRQAGLEHRWDNYTTARYLRRHASDLDLALTDSLVCRSATFREEIASLVSLRYWEGDRGQDLTPTFVPLTQLNRGA